MNDWEREVKFCVRDLTTLKARLVRLGAVLLSPRVHEYNLRFDTPERALSRRCEVLRLRRAHTVQLTYKGPSRDTDGVRIRREIEIEIDDFDAARRLLEALGFRVVMVYEKYRTVYTLETVAVMLDELPYGTFVELESADETALRQIAHQLGLRWEAAIMSSYLGLLHRLQTRRRLALSELTFAALQGVRVTPADLGVVYADEG